MNLLPAPSSIKPPGAHPRARGPKPCTRPIRDAEIEGRANDSDVEGAITLGRKAISPVQMGEGVDPRIGLVVSEVSHVIGWRDGFWVDGL